LPEFQRIAAEALRAQLLVASVRSGDGQQGLVCDQEIANRCGGASGQFFNGRRSGAVDPGDGILPLLY
jgi:hypothetical protein